MEFIIDTVDLEEIKEAVTYLPITGVTSNPSIVKKTSPKEFFAHMRKIKEIIGEKRSLHIQLIARDYEGMCKEAVTILKEVGRDTYIKVPATFEGIRVMKTLKEKGIHVTATAVYDIMQAYLSLEAGVDYIAPYVNRIGNLDGDPYALIEDLSKRIKEDGYQCKIVAASFKGIKQIKDSYRAGAHATTSTYDLLKAIFANPNIEKAVHDFNRDWYSMYGEGVGILDLSE